MEVCRPQKYCGILSLRVGIYIKSFFNLIVGILTLRLLIVLIMDYADALEDFYWEPEDNGNFNRNFTDNELEIIKHQQIVFTFLLIWILFKTCYIVIIFFTVWVVYKQNRNMLKKFLYINIQNWIIDVLYTIAAGQAIDISYKVILNIVALTEVYNLLAIRSEYKRLTGKMALINSESETANYPNGFISPPPRDLCFSTLTTDIHCRTCTCNLTPILETPVTFPPQLTTVPENIPLDDPPTPDKELNFKEQPIIYNQSQLIERHSSVIDYEIDFNQPHSSAYYSPPAMKSDEKKVDISDIPVIYDENQLNVGSSPVIEDRKEVANK